MIYYYDIAPLSKTVIQKPLTYASNEKRAIGQLVQINLRSVLTTGIILCETTKPKFKTITIKQALSEEPSLPNHLVEAAQWLNNFYHAPISSIAKSVLPSGIGKQRRQLKTRNDTTSQLAHLPLTKMQSTTWSEITKSHGNVWLHGETGSGKTRLYIELVNNYLKAGKDCIVLTPEISLTPQLIKQFSTYSEAANIFVIHSKISATKKHQIWRDIARSTKPCLVIGTRSAIFMPLQQLGLIIVDEAHDGSYKQDSHPKYHVIRLASFISMITGSKAIFGTATPPVSELFFAKNKKLSVVSLGEKVFADKRKIELVDLRNYSNFTRHRWLSNKLLTSMETNLSDNNQTLLLLNRRGTRQNVACNNCGWYASCENCQTPMRYHHDLHAYLCHLCGNKERARTSCPTCHNPNISMSGIGTKQLEIDVRKLFPSAKVIRYDQDSLKQHKSHDNVYKILSDKNTDIIIGTQLITKGFDLGRLTTVAAIHADTGLQLPDFSSSEATFQMLYQLAGRAGRRGQASNVFIQTFMPDNYAIKEAVNHTYQDFYEAEINQRRINNLPPFSFLLLLRTKLKTKTGATKKATDLAAQLARLDGISVLGPSPAFYEYANGYYNWQLVVKSRSRNKLVEIVERLPAGWDFELDPINLL